MCRERMSLIIEFPACVVNYFVGSFDQVSDDTAPLIWIGPAQRTEPLKCKKSLMPILYPSRYVEKVTENSLFKKFIDSNINEGIVLRRTRSYAFKSVFGSVLIFRASC